MQESGHAYRGTSAPREASRGLREYEWCYVAESFGLSDRELDIVQLYFEELEEAEIADRLGISEHTVRSHRRRLQAKIGASNRASLILRVCLRIRDLDREIQ